MCFLTRAATFTRSFYSKKKLIANVYIINII